MQLLPGAQATDVFGPGEAGPVFVSEVECRGSETSLSVCPSAGLGQHSCGLENTTAGVICGRNGANTSTHTITAVYMRSTHGNVLVWTGTSL